MNDFIFQLFKFHNYKGIISIAIGNGLFILMERTIAQNIVILVLITHHKDCMQLQMRFYELYECGRGVTTNLVDTSFY